MKRPASAGAKGPVAKKPATARSDTRVKAVVDAVLKADGFPESVLKMLGANVALTLGVPKEERHDFQEQVSSMVGEVLSAVEAAAKEKIATAEAKFADLGQSKAGLESTAEAAAADLAAKSTAADSAKTEVGSATAALKAAKAAVTTAESDQKAFDADLEAIAAKKVHLESSLAETFVPLKEGNKEAVKGSVAELVKVGKEFEFDQSLMSSLPSAFSKDPESRGSFDSMVITQVESEIANKIAALAETLKVGEPAKAAAAEKVATTQAELTTATEKDVTCKAESEAAKAAQKEAEGTSKAASKALKDFEPDMKKASKALDAAKDILSELTAGPLKAYAELLELSNAPPPVAEEEAPAVAMDAEAAPAEQAVGAVAAEVEVTSS